MKNRLKEDVDIASYEPDDGPLTLEQSKAIQKLADDRARAQGKTPPSEIPEENWQTLF